MTELLKAKEVSARLRISPVSLWRMVARGELPVIRISERRWFFRPEDIETFLEQRRGLHPKAPKSPRRSKKARRRVK